MATALRAKKGSFSSQGRGARQPAERVDVEDEEGDGQGDGDGLGQHGGSKAGQSQAVPAGARCGGALDGLEVAEQGQDVEEPGEDVAPLGRPGDGLDA